MYATTDVTMGTGSSGVSYGTVGMAVLLSGADGMTFDCIVSFVGDLIGEPLPAAVADAFLGAGADDGVTIGLHTFVDAMAMPGVSKLRSTSFFVVHVRGCAMSADPSPDTDGYTLPAEVALGDNVVEIA